MHTGGKPVRPTRSRIKKRRTQHPPRSHVPSGATDLEAGSASITPLSGSFRTRAEVFERSWDRRPSSRSRASRRRDKNSLFSCCARWFCRACLITMLLLGPLSIYWVHQTYTGNLEVLHVSPNSLDSEELPQNSLEMVWAMIQGATAATDERGNQSSWWNPGPSEQDSGARGQSSASGASPSRLEGTYAAGKAPLGPLAIDAARKLGADRAVRVGADAPVRFVLHQGAQLRHLVQQNGAVSLQENPGLVMDPVNDPAAEDVHLPHSWNQKLDAWRSDADPPRGRPAHEFFKRGVGVYSIPVEPLMTGEGFPGDSQYLGSAPAADTAIPTSFELAFEKIHGRGYALPDILGDFVDGEEALKSAAQVGVDAHARAHAQAHAHIDPHAKPDISSGEQSAAQGIAAGAGSEVIQNDVALANPSGVQASEGLGGSEASAPAGMGADPSPAAAAAETSPEGNAVAEMQPSVQQTDVAAAAAAPVGRRQLQEMPAGGEAGSSESDLRPLYLAAKAKFGASEPASGDNPAPPDATSESPPASNEGEGGALVDAPKDFPEYLDQLVNGECAFGVLGSGACVRVFFKAEAAATEARVFYDGLGPMIEIGQHSGGYTPFEVDLTGVGRRRFWPREQHVRRAQQMIGRLTPPLRKDAQEEAEASPAAGAADDAAAELGQTQGEGPVQGDGQAPEVAGDPGIPSAQKVEATPISGEAHAQQSAPAGDAAPSDAAVQGEGAPPVPPVAVSQEAAPAATISNPPEASGGAQPEGPVGGPSPSENVAQSSTAGPVGAAPGSNAEANPANTQPGDAAAAAGPDAVTQSAPGESGEPGGGGGGDGSVPAQNAPTIPDAAQPQSEGGPQGPPVTAAAEGAPEASGAAAEAPPAASSAGEEQERVAVQPVSPQAPEGQSAPAESGQAAPIDPAAVESLKMLLGNNKRMRPAVVTVVDAETVEFEGQAYALCGKEFTGQNTCSMKGGQTLLFGVPDQPMIALRFARTAKPPYRCSSKYFARVVFSSVPDPAPGKLKQCFKLKEAPQAAVEDPPSGEEAAAAGRRLQATDALVGGGSVQLSIPNPSEAKKSNVLVATENMPNVDTLPGELVDWFVCGGLKRDAYLFATGPIHIAYIHASFRRLERNHFGVDVDVYLDIDMAWLAELQKSSTLDQIAIEVPVNVRREERASAASEAESEYLCAGVLTARIDPQRIHETPNDFAGLSHLGKLYTIKSKDRQVLCRYDWQAEHWDVGKAATLYEAHAEALYTEQAGSLGSGTARRRVFSDAKSVVFGYSGLRVNSLKMSGDGRLYSFGKPILVKGTHIQEDQGDAFGCLQPREKVQELLELVQEAGFNMIRLSHFPHSKHVFDLAMRMGLLIWVDIPWYRGGLGDESHQFSIQAHLVETIFEHKNNPAVFAWGLANEPDAVTKWEIPDASARYEPTAAQRSDPQRITDFLRRLHALAKFLDAGRYTGLRSFAPAAGVVDIYSPSIWPGWYQKQFVMYEDMIRAEAEALKLGTDEGPGALLHLEWGATAARGQHQYFGWGHSLEHSANIWESTTIERASKTLAPEQYSENYQLDVANWILRSREHGYGMSGRPQIMGDAMWIFRDSRSPQRCTEDRAGLKDLWCTNAKGAVTLSNEKKDLYYLFKSVQKDAAEDPVCYVESPTWPTHNLADKTTPVTLRVYSNCAFVALAIDGRLGEKKARKELAFPAAGLSWTLFLEPGQHMITAECDCPMGIRRTTIETVVNYGAETPPA